MVIPAFIINLEERADRLKHIVQQFANRPEFQLTIFKAIKDPAGAAGLWQGIVKIVSIAEQQNLDLVLICEDDHEFTVFYSKEHLLDCITEAKDNRADILLGGVSSLHGALSVAKSVFWTDGFTGLQFTIIFNRFFKHILSEHPAGAYAADHRISALSENKFFIHPFISVQKEFGYSDVTIANNEEGRVTDLFAKASQTVCYLQTVREYYSEKTADIGGYDEEWENINIPTYIINLPKRRDRLLHIYGQFAGRKEFAINIIKAIEHNIGAVGLWLTIRKIVQMAIDDNEDLIIICEDDHEFTSSYSRDFLLKNIIEAHHQNADVLSGGIGGGFRHALPVSENRFWVNHFFCTQFIVIYRKFFDKILSEHFDNSVTADDAISMLTSHKMVLYPFISIQKDFGYSDVTVSNDQKKGLISYLFEHGASKLALHKSMHEKFSYYRNY